MIYERLKSIFVRNVFMTSMKKFWGTNDWAKRYVFAQKQAIVGIAFGEIEKLDSTPSDLPKSLLFQWIADVERVKRQNLKVNQLIEELCRLLENNDIKYAVVKGQVAASYYEHPELRSSGDIDYYVSEKDVEKAKKLICTEWRLEMKKDDSPYHYHFEHGGVSFEMHFKLFLFYQNRRDGYWQNLLNQSMEHYITIGRTKVATLEPTMHVLYVFLHLYHHLLELGVGLRQFYDWAMILHACKDIIDHEAIKRHLKVFGMEKAYRACGAILVRDLGLPANEFTYELTDYDMRYADKVLDIVFYRGNMGHYNKRGGFHGWKHKLESTAIKLSHFVKFYSLAPSFMRDWAWDVVKSRL